MTAIAENVGYQLQINTSQDAISAGFLRVAICAPELEQLQRAMSGGPADATHIIQGYVAAGMQSRGHTLTFLTPRRHTDIVCTSDLKQPTLAPQTWSANRWFELAHRGSWRMQQALGMPYLNYFSNYRLYDACLQCLPGHDVVYERNTLYKSGVAMACKRLGLPYVLYFEADDIIEHDYMGKPITGLLRWRAKTAARYNLNAADCIICVSEPAKAHLIRKWNVPAEKIVVFPNAADVNRFRPNPEANVAVRSAWGVEGKRLIFFVGGFYEWHDVATLLDGFAQVLVTNPDAYLVLIGDGSQREEMMQRSADLGISHAVQFTGMVPHAEVPDLIAAADIAVVPYPAIKRELWLSPLKLFEYMASGKAIVASAVGQLTDVIQDGQNGLLVPAGDVTAMAVALRKLLGDQALQAQLSQQAREDAVQMYSWDHYASRLERLFTAVIAGQPVNQI